MERLDLYKCDICGNLVEVFIAGGGELVWCGQPMHKLEPKIKEDAALEKHVPVFTKLDNGKDVVRVGEVLHPMIDEHYIVFIESVSEDKNSVQLKFLHPGEKPEMILEQVSGKNMARELCNIHGLWEGQSD